MGHFITAHTPLLEQYLTKIFNQNQIQKLKLKTQLQKLIGSRLLVEELQQPVLWAIIPGLTDANIADVINKPDSELSYFIRQK